MPVSSTTLSKLSFLATFASFANLCFCRRVFVKKMLAYVPVVGWSWLMSDVVFLARDWEKDKLKLAEGVKQVNHVNCKRPIIPQTRTLKSNIREALELPCQVD